ncbi:MAG: hypothetical protein OXI69_15280 [Acidobacteriota bacterium]|nr:hypothetical protein [Acidobacteriota bacterium]
MNSRLKQFLLSLAKVVLGIAVLVAAGNEVLGSLSRMESSQVRYSAPILGLSLLCYLVGMAVFAEFWRRGVGALGGKLPRLDCHFAYFVSQLGKYVPGKAWVILIRYGLIGKNRLSFRAVTASSVYETFNVMGSGALLSFLVLLLLGGDTVLLWLALGLSAALLVASHPPVSGWIAKVAGWGSGSEEQPLPVPSWRVFWKATPLLILGWILAGASFPLAGAGIGVHYPGPSEVVLAGAASGLAVAAGFVVLVAPAGLGVREWLLVQALGPSVGEGPAALVAVAARGLQVCGELGMAGVLYGLRKTGGPHA